jgi:hypothetical protein
MDELAALMLKAHGGDPESQRLLLNRYLRNLRLFAAAFLPTLADIDRVVFAVAGEATRAFAEASEGDAFAGWLRGLMRRRLNDELAALAGDAGRQADPLARAMIASARERLKNRIADIDPEEALRRRLQLTPKGALDLLAQRFGRGQPLARLAELRGLSVDDLTIALQTACRQLDWSGDAFCGAALDIPHYRTLDGLLCNDPDSDGRELRQAVQGDPELAGRSERAARAYLIAAAWYTPELALAAPPPAPAPGTRRITNSGNPPRRIPTPGAGSQVDRPAPKPTSAGTRRIAAPSRRGMPAAEARDQDRGQGATIIIVAVAAVLVLGGLLALYLRGGTTHPLPATPVAALPADTPATTAGDQSPVAAPSAPAKPANDPAPAGPAPAGDRQALFSGGAGALPMPLAAYSVRRLVGGYGGPLLKVRRTSDGAERDIAATSAGTLDTASLTLFIGRSDGQVMTWYDQSGAGNHLTQPAPATQPLIARKGTMESENGRPALSFERTRFQHLTAPGALAAGNLFVLVRSAGPDGGAQGLIGSRSDSAVEIDAYYPIVDRDRNGMAEWWLGQQGTNEKLELPMPARRLVLWHSASDGAAPPTLTLRLDGGQAVSRRLSRAGNPASGPTTVGCLYWKHNLVDPFSGSLGEVIMLPPALTPEAQAAITANLKAWWHLP